MKFIYLLLLFLCSFGILKAQTQNAVPQNPVSQRPAPMQLGKNDTIKVYETVVDGKLVPWIITEEIKIFDSRIFASQEQKEAYDRLAYNVIKVLPYAHFAGERYRQLQRDLALTADKHKQKELISACDNQIKDLFKREVENLTISQGEVLIKLIDRETGNTSYDLVKQLKGGLDAFMLQSVARLFGHNLKQTYDPNEDRDIETILQKAGYDSYKN
jgi:hypothetical protein